MFVGSTATLESARGLLVFVSRAQATAPRSQYSDDEESRAGVRLSAGVGAGICAALFLTGCSSTMGGRATGGAQPGLTVEAAKEIAQGIEDDLVSGLPDGSVRSTDQETTGVLLPCGGESAYAWTGATTIELSATAEPSELISSVIDAYRDNADLKPRDITSNGRARAQLVGPYGSGYIIADRQDGYLEISSFSPCFDLPPGKAPESEY